MQPSGCPALSWLLKGGGLVYMTSMAPRVWLRRCRFHKLYLGPDQCGSTHGDEEMQPEPAERCLGKGFFLQFQTTHTCTVDKCSRGYGSTAFMLRPKALLCSTRSAPPPPPAFPRTVRLHGNFREKVGGCLLGTPAHSNKERNLEVF